MNFEFVHIRVTAETKVKPNEAARLTSLEQGRVVMMSALVIEAALE